MEEKRENKLLRIKVEGVILANPKSKQKANKQKSLTLFLTERLNFVVFVFPEIKSKSS